MGIKLLGLQMIPWCFHLMGSTAAAGKAGSGAADAPSPGSIKLITADGRVEVYHRPVSASELMSEHPRHLVCRSDAPFTVGQKIPSLAGSEQLQPGHAYLLLPAHALPSVLSFVTLASSFARATAGGARGASSPLAPSLLQKPPFDVQKTPSGKLQIRVSDAFIERIKEDGDGGTGGGVGRVCTTAALAKDYRLLVSAGRWKPRLETVRESPEITERGRLVAVAAAVALQTVRWRRKARRTQQRRGGEKKKLEVQMITHSLCSGTHTNNIGKKAVACNA